MSNATYTRLRATANRMLAKYGRDIAAKRTSMAGTVTDVPMRAVFVDRVKSVLGDSGVSIGDWRLLVNADAAPQPGDRFSSGGESLVLIDPVTPIAPGETVIAFECYARAG